MPDPQHPLVPPSPPSSSNIYNAVTQILNLEGDQLTEDDYQQIYYHFDDYAADIILANGM